MELEVKEEGYLKKEVILLLISPGGKKLLTLFFLYLTCVKVETISPFFNRISSNSYMSQIKIMPCSQLRESQFGVCFFYWWAKTLSPSNKELTTICVTKSIRK